MTRTLGAAVLAVSLTTTAVSAHDDDEHSSTRLIEPTPAELEAFQLPRPELTDLAEPPRAFAVSGLCMFAASAADLATTEWGLARGLTEGNPVASNRSARVVHHVVGPAAVWWTTERLHDSGRKKLALSLRIALMAAYGYAAVHNARQVAVVTP